MAATYATGSYGLVGGTYADLDGDDPPQPDDTSGGAPGAYILGGPRPGRPIEPKERASVVVSRVTVAPLTLVPAQSVLVIGASTVTGLALSASQRLDLSTTTTTPLPVNVGTPRHARTSTHNAASMALLIAIEDEQLLVIAASLLVTE